MLFSGLIGLMIFNGLIDFTAINWQNLTPLAWFFVGLVYFFLIHPYVTNWYRIRRFRSAGKIPGTWTFSRQGTNYKDSEADVHFKWSVVGQVIVTKRYVLLPLGTMPCHVFASSMFENTAAWHNFRIGIIRNFVGCRGCKYDLYGTDSDTCPECGKPID